MSSASRTASSRVLPPTWYQVAPGSVGAIRSRRRAPEPPLTATASRPEREMRTSASTAARPSRAPGRTSTTTGEATSLVSTGM